MFRICTDLYADPRLSLRLAVDRSKMWTPGQEIRIAFLDGTNIQMDKTVEYAEKWLKYANLHFEWVMGKKAQIRISFQRGKGSWSYVGKDALSIANPNKPTMNFGWLDNATPDEEWSRTVIHEFGHMLGAVHEHLSPASGIKWDKTFVYSYYWQTQNWSKDQVDLNIFQKYDKNISNTEYDPESIMHYPIDKSMTLDGYSVGWNRVLSEQDKDFIREIYS